MQPCKSLKKSPKPLHDMKYLIYSITGRHGNYLLHGSWMSTSTFGFWKISTSPLPFHWIWRWCLAGIVGALSSSSWGNFLCRGKQYTRTIPFCGVVQAIWASRGTKGITPVITFQFHRHLKQFAPGLIYLPSCTGFDGVHAKGDSTLQNITRHDRWQIGRYNRPSFLPKGGISLIPTLSVWLLQLAYPIQLLMMFSISVFWPNFSISMLDSISKISLPFHTVLQIILQNLLSWKSWDPWKWLPPPSKWKK